MKKIIMLVICLVAMINVMKIDAKAAPHIVIHEEAYIEELQKEYEEEQRKIEEQRKAEAKRKAEEQKKKEKAIKASGKTQVSQNEIEILYKICHAESRGESVKGQMAVANVILNRVKSNKFPDTIKGVVFQSGQFTPASKSSFNSIKPSKQIKESVDRVLAGERVVENDVLYFKSVKSGENWGKLELRERIGGHLFYAS